MEEPQSVEFGTGSQFFLSSSLPACLPFVCAHEHTIILTALSPLLNLLGTQHVGNPRASELQTLNGGE